MIAASVRGSSPLTRGKLFVARLGAKRRRLIPAHAGKTWSCSGSGRPAWAHPRSRGENVVLMVKTIRGEGSSPLTRGKHERVHSASLPGRLIPAHAGKTCLSPSEVRGAWAHPRSRGEYTLGSALAHQPPGSSPLTPGKPSPRAVRGADLRLIPAHAGKTASSLGVLGRRGAHPRSRGENAYALFRARRYRGSSLLTREKRLADLRDGLNLRLIPAHAGKTRRTPQPRTRPGAHPRSRGENGTASRPRYRARGSSPLTRGKRGDAPPGAALLRLIPAHAGKTHGRRDRPSPGPAHPRSRGENTAIPPVPLPFTGSSPLTRGKPIRAGRGKTKAGLIPAHAGKTSCV